MSDPVRYSVGDAVTISEATLANIRTSTNNRTGGRTYTSYEFLALAEKLCAEKAVGVVTHVFRPGFDTSVDFGGVCGVHGLHAKCHFIERATLDPRPARERLADFARQIEETLAAGKMPNTNFFFGSLINAIREDALPPTVVVTVEDGMAEVTAVSMPVQVVIADMDREEPISAEAVDAVLEGDLHTGSVAEVERAIASAREGLSRFLDDEAPQP